MESTRDFGNEIYPTTLATVPFTEVAMHDTPFAVVPRGLHRAASQATDTFCGRLSPDRRSPLESARRPVGLASDGNRA
jgi:hypothetical protein